MKDNHFYFFTSIGNFTGESASSLEEFVEQIKAIDGVSLEFHLLRDDFERWIVDILGYKKLALRLRRLKKRDLQGEELRTQLLKTTTSFLKTLIKKRKSKVKM